MIVHTIVHEKFFDFCTETINLHADVIKVAVPVTSSAMMCII